MVTEVPIDLGNGNTEVTVGGEETTPLRGTQHLETGKHHDKEPDGVKNTRKGGGLIFPVESIPPWYITLIYALQQVLSSISGPVSAAFIIHSTVCAENDATFLAELIETSIFMSGLCTFLQVTFGIRLPIVQGSSFVFLPVITSLMSTQQWRCPENYQKNGLSYNLNSTANVSGDFGFSNDTSGELEALWKPRMREASGALIIASSVQVLLGCTGLVGVLMRFIGPLTIAPTVSLIGLSLRSLVEYYCCQSWIVSLSTASVFIIVSQFLRDVPVPLPAYNRSRGVYTVRYPIFRLFPAVFAVAFGWILCFILTSTGSLPDQPDALGYKARTDVKTDNIANNKWFFLPYPCMWGFPTFSPLVLLGMLSATVCTIVESIGDYYATARACDVPSPPMHAMNRGIAMEGLGSVICGLLGAAHATTSYSQSIGFFPLTGMGSRITWQATGILLVLAGIFGKFGAILSTIPEPVLGGILLVSLGMVVSVGLSNIQFVDISLGRNMMILGTSLLLGLIVPDWIKANSQFINTGNSNVDQMLTILLGTPMFIGGFVGCLLDSTMPGTLEERGMLAFHPSVDQKGNNETCYAEDDASNGNPGLYDLPFMNHCSHQKWTCFTYFPFLPCYKERTYQITKKLRCCRNRETRV